MSEGESFGGELFLSRETTWPLAHRSAPVIICKIKPQKRPGSASNLQHDCQSIKSMS